MTDKHSTATYDALVDLARSLRPAWNTEGIRNAIRQALNRDPMPNLADLAYALTRICIDPTVSTPGMLARDGAHWRSTSVQSTGTRIAVKERCPTCKHLHHPDAPHVERGKASPRVDEVRAILASTRSNLCPCGVKPRDCPEHRPQPKGDA